jgi:GH25 family lysozyme M1 (1,4-beta-N-acetylmuramidase)
MRNTADHITWQYLIDEAVSDGADPETVRDAVQHYMDKEEAETGKRPSLDDEVPAWATLVSIV